jgi:hypothetical protein
MKAKELIYNLRTNLEQAGSQLQQATDQHIMFMLDEARAILASQKMEARRSLDVMAQFLDVTPTKAPVTELGTVGEASVLKVVVPKPVVYKNGEAIFTVGATDGQDSYTKVTFSQLRTVLFRKYTANSPKWLWHNNAIYIINSEVDSANKVRVRGIFDEPYRVIQAKGEYKYLKPFDWEYPLSMKDMKPVYQLAFSGDLGWGDTAAQAINREQQRQQQTDQANAQTQ